MKRGFCLAFLVAVSVCFAVQQSFAVSVALTNPSFEDPAGVKTVGDATWSNIPGWTSSGPSVDSGTEPFTPLPQPDLGVNIAFLQSGDGSIFQTTARSLAAGDIYTLTFYERDDYQATELTASLYYDDGGTRVPFASMVFTPLTAIGRSGPLGQRTLTSSLPVPAAGVGKLVGVEFVNSSGAEAVPEPSTLALIPIVY